MRPASVSARPIRSTARAAMRGWRKEPASKRNAPADAFEIANSRKDRPMPDQDHASLERVRQWLEGGAQPSMTDVGAVLALALALALRQGPVSGEAADDIIERCAIAAEAQDRAGHEWVPDSLWANILRRAGENVRALKASPSAIPAGGEGEGWRPIESAPRDGTRILAWQDGDLYAVEWVYEAPDEGYWIARCGQPVVTPPTPTHWMPPPPAPSQEGGGRE